MGKKKQLKRGVEQAVSRREDSRKGGKRRARITETVLKNVHALAGINVQKCPHCNSKFGNVFIPVTLRELAIIRMGGLVKEAFCLGNGPFGNKHKVRVEFI